MIQKTKNRFIKRKLRFENEKYLKKVFQFIQ